jgi:hypothetical protein
MENDLKRAQIEADAKVRVAEIEAKAKVDAAKQQRKSGRFQSVNVYQVLAGLAVFVFFGGGLGGLIYQHVNHTNKYAEQIQRCEDNGGVWTPRIQRVHHADRSEGYDMDEWYEICVKGK